MTEHSTEAAAHSEGHADPNYVKIWAILLGLLVVSVLGPLAGIPALTLITAFGVAVVKAYLVVRNFMHLNVEPRYVGYLLATGLAFMLLLFAGVAPDVMQHQGQNWTNVAAEDAIRRATTATNPEEHGPVAPVPPEVAFQRTCSPCHGAAGRGDGPASASLNPKPANFTAASFWESRDRAHVARVIRGGGASVGRSPMMPSFGGQFDLDAAAALANYVRTTFGPPEAPAAAAPDGGTAAAEPAPEPAE